MTWPESLQMFGRLLVLFAPIVLLGLPRARSYRLNTLDSLVWWLASVQTAALLTLWCGLFRPLPFLAVYILIATTVAVVRVRARDPQDAEDQASTAGSDRLSPSTALVAGVILAAAIVPIGTYLEVPRQADALSYHLPMAAQWVQTQSIFAHDSRLWYYPGGYELVNAVLLLLTGSDALWFVPDLLAWVLLALATYALLQRVGLEQASAAVVLATLAVTPVVTRTLGMGDNDLWLTALAVTATEALLRSLATDSREARAAGIVCLGALVSTKYSAPLWLLLAVAYFVMRRTTPVPALKPVEIAAMVLGAVLLISFPLRNQILTGNPIYPTGLGSLIAWGDTSMLVRGVRAITPEELASSALIGQPLVTWEMFLAKIIGYMPVLPLLLAAVVTICLARPHDVAFERKDALLLTACLLALAILVFQPLVVENIPGTRNQLGSGRAMRFALAFYVLSIVFLIARVPRRFAFHAALGLLAVSMFWHGTYQWISAIFAIAVPLFLDGRLSPAPFARSRSC